MHERRVEDVKIFADPRRFFRLLRPAVFRSIELKAVAAVSVLLYSGGEELRVRGPVQISLPLGPGAHLRASDTVPAWAFNLKTGTVRWEPDVHRAGGAPCRRLTC